MNAIWYAEWIIISFKVEETKSNVSGGPASLLEIQGLVINTIKYFEKTKNNTRHNLKNKKNYLYF